MDYQRTANNANSVSWKLSLWISIWIILSVELPISTTVALLANNRIDPEPLNICEHCHCQGQTLSCNFANNRSLSEKWNTAYMVPTGITAIKVQLADQTQFQLHGGFFRRNRVNRFEVRGPNAPTGNDQVELLAHAFRGNQGGYPDIQILGVSSVFIRNHSFSDGEIKLRVEKSDLLVLFQDAFINMNMSCSFVNVRSLEINEKSFNPSPNRTVKASVNLNITHSRIAQINRFDMSMNKIVFVNCIIGIVQSQAFDVTNINLVAFENCQIEKIEPEAFTSKLLSENVTITGTHIGTIESKAISGSGISTLTLKNNTIDIIKEDAILVHSVYVYIESNRINHLGQNWLINLEDNHLNNFSSIQLNPNQAKRAICTFVNNMLRDPQPNSLNIGNCEVRGNNVDRECKCDETKYWLLGLTDHDRSSEIYCQLDERQSACLRAKNMNLRKYENEVCDRTRNSVRCADNSTMHWYKDVLLTKEERDYQKMGVSSYTVVGYTIAGILVLMIPFAAISCCCCNRKCCCSSQETRGKPQIGAQSNQNTGNAASARLLNGPNDPNSLSNQRRHIYQRPDESNDVDDRPPAYQELDHYAMPTAPLPPPPVTQPQQMSPTSGACSNPNLDVIYSTPQDTYADTQSIVIYDTPVWHSKPDDAPETLAATPKAMPTPSRSANGNANNNNYNLKHSLPYRDGAASLDAMELMDMRGATALPPDCNSDHSGGSDATVQMEDIEYADD